MPEAARRPILPLLARDFGAALALFAAGAWFMRRRRSTPGGAWGAAVYLLVYPVALSVWAVDLIMALTDSAPSSIVPVQSFMAAFLSAVALAALLSCRRRLEARVRLDLGRLLYGLACFWAYLVWCSYLPVWYANLPDEVGEVMARVDGGWAALSWGVIGATFLVPFVALLPEAAKRNRLLLGLAAACVLAGLFAERFLLVLRPAQPGGGISGIILGAVVASGAAGAFVLTVGGRMAESSPATSPR
jgi:hypothetical protein